MNIKDSKEYLQWEKEIRKYGLLMISKLLEKALFYHTRLEAEKENSKCRGEFEEVS